MRSDVDVVKIFRGKDIIGNVVVALIFFFIGYAMLDIQIIGAIALMIGGLIATIPIFIDDLKTVLYEDKIVIHKIFRTNTILLRQINNLFKEPRAYGKYGTRECLIITYTEPSGYSDELVYPYDTEMHTIIEKQLTQLHQTDNSG